MSNGRVCVLSPAHHPPPHASSCRLKALRLKGVKRSSLRGRIKGGGGRGVGKSNFAPLEKKKWAAVTRQPPDQVSKPDKEL